MKLPLKNSISLALLVSVSALAVPCFASEPIVQTRFTADPAPMVHDGVLYLYTTHDEDDAPAGTGQFRMRDWLLYTSTDMVNWTDKGTVASLKSFSWAASGYGRGNNGAWAHQTIERNGKFYMYCTVQGAGIGVLVANKPEGPFTDPIGKPLINNNYDTIDPTVFIDDDGQAHLYWGNPNLWHVKLNNDMISTSGEITKDASIAKVPGQTDPFHYQEGPWVYKWGGHYYNAYASTCCPEGIGYAMSKSPAGPWEYKGYVMKPDRRASGNHPGIIDYRGKSYVFGFSYKLNFMQTDKHHERRSVGVAEMKYNADGTIQEVPWWEEAPQVKQLKPLNPYNRIEAETMSWSQGMKSGPRNGGGMNVYPTRDGSYTKVQGVDFGAEGAGTFTASVMLDTKAGIVKGGLLELRLDGAKGELIGTVPVSNTDGQWKSETTNVQGAKGVHDLFFVFKGESASEMFKLDSWRFAKKGATPQLVAINASIDRYKIDTAPASNTANLKVLAIYSDGTGKDVTAQTMAKAAKAGIVSVKKGVLTGAAAGSTSLTFSYGGKTDTLSLMVKDLKTEFTVSKLTPNVSDVKLITGSSQPLTVVAEYLDGHTEDVTETATYISANPQVAVVENGVILAKGQGSTVVRMSFKGEVGTAADVQVNVGVTNRNPFTQNEAEDFTQQQGVDIEASSENGRNASGIHNGDWIRVNALDFGTGADSLQLRVASATKGGTIEVRLDSLNGPLVGTCQVEETGGWQNWVTKSCDIEGVQGIHDVVFKFTGGEGYLFNVNWWKFGKALN
jgi:hypothetical protein